MAGPPPGAVPVPPRMQQGFSDPRMAMYYASPSDPPTNSNSTPSSNNGNTNSGNGGASLQHGAPAMQGTPPYQIMQHAPPGMVYASNPSMNMQQFANMIPQHGNVSNGAYGGGPPQYAMPGGVSHAPPPPPAPSPAAPPLQMYGVPQNASGMPLSMSGVPPHMQIPPQFNHPGNMVHQNMHYVAPPSQHHGHAGSNNVDQVFFPYDFTFPSAVQLVTSSNVILLSSVEVIMESSAIIPTCDVLLQVVNIITEVAIPPTEDLSYFLSGVSRRGDRLLSFWVISFLLGWV